MALHYQKANKALHVENALGEAEIFYSRNCHMIKAEKIIAPDYILPKEAVKQLLSQNEKHTGSKIEYLL
ncbi:MAG: hypothetical protein IKU37_01725 [Candidatus Gastranaerophilales bacterium]|nr:hypothetical protein [Candidatus Gastranaerophilales bacterium]